MNSGPQQDIGTDALSQNRQEFGHYEPSLRIQNPIRARITHLYVSHTAAQNGPRQHFSGKPLCPGIIVNVARGTDQPAPSFTEDCACA